MKNKQRLCSLVCFFCTLSSTGLNLSAQEVKVCRISVENPSTHFQALAARRFADKWVEKAHGSVKVEFYDGASLFRDTDALRALARGQVEIIFPGLWQLDRYVPDFGSLMLPSVYERQVPTMRALVDGPFGDALIPKVETALEATTLGPWLDGGYGHIFTLSTSVRSAKDIAGKRIRVAGGKGNEERLIALGADTVSIPLADLATYLDNRLVDGILSTYEAVDSARLDRNGIRAVLEDKEYYPFYLPLVGNRFWASLSDAQRKAAKEAWAEVVGTAREESVRSHAEAKARLVSRGLVVYETAEDEGVRIREMLMRSEMEMARRLNISSETLQRLDEGLQGQP
jgi:C4-dicarboxylate-binding protein DctP